MINCINKIPRGLKKNKGKVQGCTKKNRYKNGNNI